MTIGDLLGNRWIDAVAMAIVLSAAVGLRGLSLEYKTEGKDGKGMLCWALSCAGFLTASLYATELVCDKHFECRRCVVDRAASTYGPEAPK